jgi:exodeoxyribonuclease VII small subunit
MTDNNNFDFAKALMELEEINRWFQDEEIDLDLGLEKLKRGKALIDQCQGRLGEVENEFVKIKETFSENETEEINDSEILESEN